MNEGCISLLKTSFYFHCLIVYVHLFSELDFNDTASNINDAGPNFIRYKNSACIVTGRVNSYHVERGDGGWCVTGSRCHIDGSCREVSGSSTVLKPSFRNHLKKFLIKEINVIFSIFSLQILSFKLKVFGLVLGKNIFFTRAEHLSLKCEFEI